VNKKEFTAVLLQQSSLTKYKIY